MRPRYFIAAVLLFEVASIGLFLAAANLATLNDPAKLLRTGDHSAALLRTASLLDMLGYLSAIPIALYLRERFRDEPGIELFTLAGVLFMATGALAAVAFAAAGPPLIHEYAASTSGRYGTEKAFETVYRIVFYGAWQTLDPILAAAWAVGVGLIARKYRETALSGVLIAIGAVAAAFFIARMTGALPAA